MIKKLTLLTTTMISLFAFLFAPMVVQTAYAADNKEAACEGLELTGRGCDGTADATINNVIKVVIDIFSVVVGVTAVIMIMVGGFKYIVSSGDSSNVNSAKNTILYALVGLVIVVLAQVIVRFVLGRL